MHFKLVSEYSPTGDQPEAIKELTKNIESNIQHSTLWGVTGSGKTFTMANIISNINRPTLILSHNKTLAAQLYGEFKSFFPDNAVEYFVSYYDYYQPEAYLPSSDTYIEKDLSINEEIEKLRLKTTSTLLSGRKDVIVVSSVSCLYGIGNPSDFHANTIKLKVGEIISRIKLLHNLTDALYSRSDIDFRRGTFRVKGDNIDVFAAYADTAYRISFFDDEIENIYQIDPITGDRFAVLEDVIINPANIFVTTRERINNAVNDIQDDMMMRFSYFNQIDKTMEANRLKSRVEHDLEMIKEVGYCSGIENYSRYFDGRSHGSRPFCLLDYFPDDFFTIIDESHVTIPQVRAMYGGDFARKTNLVDYGFRLPSALDNRPLKFEEFEKLTKQMLYVSATPAEYELIKSEGVIVEQFIRPTGLLDPEIEVRKTANQIDRILEDIESIVKADERVMIVTLTKRMAEELTTYLSNIGIRCRYIHSDVDNMERIELLEDYRNGLFDVLVGVNLLREGLDLPEVSMVVIMDADKEGFLRSTRSLTQTAGRAARNINGRVIMYADKVTDSMRATIDATNSRRSKQMNYNTDNNITPKQIIKSSNLSSLIGGGSVDIPTRKQTEVHKIVNYDSTYLLGRGMTSKVADSGENSYSTVTKDKLIEMIKEARENMNKAAVELDFHRAAEERDKMYHFENLLKKLE